VTRKALIVRPHLACGDGGNQSVLLAVAFLRGKEESSRGIARYQIVLKHDPKAWEEGFKAGESRVRIPLRCPYPAGTTQAWSWHSGHVEGDAKREGYSYSRGAFSKGPPSRGPIIP
jgi:hypothetical protein